MKHLLTIVLAALISCTSQPSAEQQDNKPVNENKDTEATSPLTGNKWKADDATKKNVAAMAEILADTTYADPAKKNLLYASLKERVDTLVKECSMKGAAHDALHVWLEKVLNDLKELKEEDGQYTEAYTELKKDVAGFNQSFE